ncbi:YqiA/YcfP family alpha/beta fold hydrolase [Neptunomonas antarctica]|uniref:Esterase n=1 Tax=Neptunomonas antarctica TaxID=619304 RepID=A0A1N7J7A9_9GAMM|nr:YqiA/YcfP family alpha/beta fold hydrolase [Neptunomonas antarctica]SIS45200.1 hypothetical protein SAMN05421760_101713 [Neptunomonas antarctica]
MLSPLFIYVHGFNSSPDSIKARLLGEYLAMHADKGDYVVPHLSHWPGEAMQQLEVLVQEHTGRPIVLVGSSLGGYYSLWLTEHYEHCRAVLVNPAMYPYLLLSGWLGDNQNIYTHESYTLTREHLQQLQAVAIKSINDPARYLLLVQTADEVLDYREAVEFFKHSEMFVQSGGSHGFDQFEKLIPAIISFSRGQAELPEATPLPSFTE